MVAVYSVSPWNVDPVQFQLMFDVYASLEPILVSGFSPVTGA